MYLLLHIIVLLLETIHFYSADSIVILYGPFTFILSIFDIMQHLFII